MLNYNIPPILPPMIKQAATEIEDQGPKRIVARVQVKRPGYGGEWDGWVETAPTFWRPRTRSETVAGEFCKIGLPARTVINAWGHSVPVAIAQAVVPLVRRLIDRAEHEPPIELPPPP